MSEAGPAVTDPAQADRVPAIRIATAFLLPLFFVIFFPIAYVSAIHAPSPHHMDVAVVGPTQVVSKIATGLEKSGDFRVTQTDETSQARKLVHDRKVAGSILITVQPATSSGSAAASSGSAADATTFTVQTYVASGGGRSAASVIESVSGNVAKQLGTTAKTTDVAPLVAADELGTNLFYLLIYTSIGAYLSIIVLTQVLPQARLRVRYLVATIAGVVAPLFVFGLSAIFVGDYNASFGTIAALIGVDVIYAFTVAALAIFVQQFLGTAATFGVMAFIVFLNFPSAGGAVPEGLLPPFWQFIHSFYFGAGALESFRSLIYFGGSGLGRWLVQLAIWPMALIVLTNLVNSIKKERRLKGVIADLKHSSNHHRHVLHENPNSLEASDDDSRRALSAGTAH